MDRSNKGQRARQLAKKNLDEALSLDVVNDHKGAFQQYLRSLSSVCDALLEESDDSNCRKSTNRKKLLNLAKQCMDRIEFLGNVLDDQNSPEQPLETELARNKIECENKTKSFTNEALNSQDLPVFQDSCSIDKNSFSLLNIPITYLETIPADCLNFISKRPKELTPLELVQRDNQQLMAAYKARLARTQNVGAQINLHLSLQRRMAENVTLAWAKQQVFIQRNQEQQQRLLEQATRRIKKLSPKNSKEEEQFLAKILEYEQKEKWPLHFKEKLKEDPENFSLMDYVVKQTLRMDDHPIYHLMINLQNGIYGKIYRLLYLSKQYSKANLGKENVNDNKEEKNSKNYNNGREDFLSECDTRCYSALADKKLSVDMLNNKLEEINSDLDLKNNHDEQASFNDCFEKNDKRIDTHSEVKEVSDVEFMQEEALKNHLANVVIDVQTAVEKLTRILFLTYAPMKSIYGKEQCYSSMEELFFKPIWPSLISLFRLVYRKEEALMAQIMTDLKDITLKELGVPEHYWLDEYISIKAIDEMKNTVNCSGPLNKLETLAKVARIICGNTSENAAPRSVGADDLISIFCYILIHTGLSELISECYAMEQLIPEGYLLGDGGYCLTAVKTAFHYLATRSQQ